mmetsp:Transcript_51756/g.150420  ORF Transcript_51756/g.150420 Transcript_51756/m.150420 type:complete len:247 (-) Transcript_51756:100-840(-)
MASAAERRHAIAVLLPQYGHGLRPPLRLLAAPAGKRPVELLLSLRLQLLRFPFALDLLRPVCSAHHRRLLPQPGLFGLDHDAQVLLLLDQVPLLHPELCLLVTFEDLGRAREAQRSVEGAGAEGLRARDVAHLPEPLRLLEGPDQILLERARAEALLRAVDVPPLVGEQARGVPVALAQHVVSNPVPVPHAHRLEPSGLLARLAVEALAPLLQQGRGDLRLVYDGRAAHRAGLQRGRRRGSRRRSP